MRNSFSTFYTKRRDTLDKNGEAVKSGGTATLADKARQRQVPCFQQPFGVTLIVLVIRRISKHWADGRTPPPNRGLHADGSGRVSSQEQIGAMAEYSHCASPTYRARLSPLVPHTHGGEKEHAVKVKSIEIKGDRPQNSAGGLDGLHIHAKVFQKCGFWLEGGKLITAGR